MSVKSENNVLELCNVSKIYPGVIALRDINLEIEEGEVHGLIGKNGAGKSTLVNIVSGVIAPTEGEIFVNGKRFSHLTRSIARENGISIITQDAQLIPEFTVAESLFAPNLQKKNGLIDWKSIYAEAQKKTDKTSFNIDVTMKARDLSMSVQKFVLLIKAFYVDKSSIVILDEFSASISPKDQDVMFGIIREAKESGKTVLYITHRMEEIKKICDRVTVIRDGKSVATENCALLSEAKLTSYIVGISENQKVCDYRAETKINLDTSPVVLSVEKISSLGKFDNISFSVKKGEILGLAGLRGSGRTEILRAISGIDQYYAGSIKVENNTVKANTPWEAKEAGIVYMTEERDTEGLILNHTVQSNLLISVLDKLIKKIFISFRKEEKMANELINKVQIKATARQEVQTLSGGNRQKVVIGRVISGDPKVMLLDEPTKGIDVGAIKNILSFIKNELSENMAIVITSPGLGDLIDICDRILVLSKGKIVCEFPSGEFNEETIYSLM
jgi:ABC-type sugar transport system ATPase subunit